jgi:peroxiredoxin
MKKKSIKFYSVLIFSLFFLILAHISIDSAEGLTPWLIDKLINSKAPDFSLTDLNGKSLNLSSFKGRPILLNFWASWCPYCRKERAHLNKLHEDFTDKKLVIISVSIDKSLAQVKSFMKKHPAEFPVLWDHTGKVSSTYNVSALPTSYLINSDGIIKKKITGFKSWTSANAKQLINELIIN